MTKGILKGMATLRFHAADLQAAQAWYTEFLGIEPYFQKTGYIEFRLGDYQAELGIADSKFRPPVPAEAGGAILYWQVDDVAAVVARAVALGAVAHEPQREFGGGFYGATLVDPFGNLLGLMNNPHYLGVLLGVPSVDDFSLPRLPAMPSAQGSHLPLRVRTLPFPGGGRPGRC